MGYVSLGFSLSGANINILNAWLKIECGHLFMSQGFIWEPSDSWTTGHHYLQPMYAFQERQSGEQVGFFEPIPQK